MDSGTVLVVVLVCTMAMACQAAETSRAADGREAPLAVALRLTIVLLIVYYLAVGVAELAAGGSGQDVLGFQGSHDRSSVVVGGLLDVGASAITLLLFLTGTARLPGLRLLRPGAPISWLVIALLFRGLAANLTPSTGAATVTATVSKPEQASDLILGVIPFGIIAVASVGPGVRRGARQALERLGLLPLRPAWWLVGLALGVVLVPAGDVLFSALSNLTSPDCLAQQQQVAQSLEGTMRTWPEQVGIAISAGVCEELLFRGALQPRIGILLSSALWASFHLQYTCHGLPSASNLYILVLGLLFGLLRQRRGLMAAIVAHTAYDGAILLGLF